ncbi:hypothetical protein [Neobacillus citreus]|uniref:Uncharacterized protein n=1 Tax=Neobacillus citreus TaxID=2833578 RepID=A0A942T654_9BACI|nr:hypothetical protein [Neobacillus citreus]MCH6264513.1 hypothetical protein [Neobacillus citreus]
MSEHKPNFRKEPIQPSHENEPAFNVFLDEKLVAEIRGRDSQHQTVIPMRELSDYEEDKLHEFIAAMYSEDEY